MYGSFVAERPGERAVQMLRERKKDFKEEKA